MFVLLSEGSIGSGVRRIEGIVSKAAERYVEQQQDTLATLSEALSAKPDELVERVERLQTDVRDLQKAMAEIKARLASADAATYADARRDDRRDARGARGRARSERRGAAHARQRDPLAAALGRRRAGRHRRRQRVAVRQRERRRGEGGRARRQPRQSRRAARRRQGRRRARAGARRRQGSRRAPRRALAAMRDLLAQQVS